VATILIVDDDQLFSAALRRTLTAADYTVRIAANVNEALSTLLTQPIDVLLTDLKMADRDGLELLWTVHHNGLATRTVLMSAMASAQECQLATALGAVAVLAKPFSNETLRATVQHAVECRTGFYGQLHGLSLIDVLQMYHYSRRSVSITIGGRISGTIIIEKGELVDAKCPGRIGMTALRDLLTIDCGWLHTAPILEAVTPTIEGRFDVLLMDSLRQIDEAV
jgi:CheY-like chemotaxis protein